MYFHTDAPRDLAWLAAVLDRAQREERSIRFDVSEHGTLRVKMGAGSWSPVLEGTPDMHRDMVSNRFGSFTMVGSFTDEEKGICDSHDGDHELNDDCVGWWQP